MAKTNLILNRYRPIAEAGAGGFGTVQVAWDTRIQRKVAIKCIELDEVDAARAALPGANAVPSYDQVDWDEVPPWDDLPDAEDMPEFVNPFRPDDDMPPFRSLAHIPGLDEARTAAMLTDPNIVTVYDFEIQGQTAYLIMEYIEGITLTKLLRDYCDYLTLNTVAAVFSSVAHALEVAHDNQVLHLDIKPDNVLINRQGQVKVTDFGLATLADASGFGAAGGGTIGYMPLEQMRGMNLDARCDEWALASVTYEMLAGQNPFLAPDLSRAEAAIEDAELVLPSLCWDELDASADDVVFYALDPDREQRYDNVTDFAEEMEKFLGEAKRGHRELAVIVGDAQEDEDEEGDDGDSSRPERMPWRERFTLRQRMIAAHVVGGVGSALVAFVALANIPPTSGFTNLLFWGLIALLALAGALKPHMGALLAYGALAIAFIVQGVPAAGCVLLAAVVGWWYAIGRRGNAAANAALALPLAGAFGFGPIAPLAAGFNLRPLRAMATAAFSVVVGVLLASCGSLNLLGWNVVANWNFGTHGNLLNNLGMLLMQVPLWCIAVSWIAAAGVLAVFRLRSTRLFAAFGVGFAGALLVGGMSLAAWIASSQMTWMPLVNSLVVTLVSTMCAFAACAFIPDFEAYDEEDLEQG